MLCLLALVGSLLAIVALAITLPCSDEERRRREHISIMEDEKAK